MTVDKVRQMIEDGGQECDSEDPIYDGLTILKKYPLLGKHSYYFAHDQMWVGDAKVDDYVRVMSDEDIIMMVNLGWIVNDDCWSHY